MIETVGPCVPDTLMWLNVSYDTDWVALHPGLAFPDVQARLNPVAVLILVLIL